MRTTHHARHRIRQSADPFSQNRPFSATFVQWVCTLAATPPEVAVAPPPTGGNDAIQASDTPATRRQRASHGATPPPPAWRAPSCFQDRHSAGSREKTRPASTKTPNLGCFKHAGRTFSRFRDDTAPQGELFRTQMKPPPPLLTHSRAHMKPATPLLAHNAAKTHIQGKQR